MWTDQDETLACGDEQLLKTLGTTRVHSNRVCRPVLSPTNPASSVACLDTYSQHGKNIFEDGEVLSLGSLQEKRSSAASANGNGLKLMCRKEDLDFSCCWKANLSNLSNWLHLLEARCILSGYCFKFPSRAASATSLWCHARVQAPTFASCDLVLTDTVLNCCSYSV